MCANYGYIRTPVIEDKSKHQKEQLKKAGILPKDIFIDLVSGKNPELTGWEQLEKKLVKGDCVFLPTLGVLGNNFNTISEKWEYIVKEVEADAVVLDMPLLDTRGTSRNSRRKAEYEVAMEIFEYFNNTRKAAARARQMEGFANARKAGIKFGRKAQELPPNFEEVCVRYQKGELKSREAGELLNVSHVTFLKWFRERY